MTITSIVLLAILFSVAFRLAVPYMSRTSAAAGFDVVNGEHKLGDCPGTPNCQSSEASRPDATVERIKLDAGPQGVSMPEIQQIVQALPGTQIVFSDERYLHAICQSPLMGYIDDLELLLSANGSELQVRSASRLGRSDLGANRKRIMQLASLIRDQL